MTSAGPFQTKLLYGSKKQDKREKAAEDGSRLHGELT